MIYISQFFSKHQKSIRLLKYDDDWIIVDNNEYIQLEEIKTTLYNNQIIKYNNNNEIINLCLEFYKLINNNNLNHYKYIGISNGLIIHPNQILFWYPSLSFLNNKKFNIKNYNNEIKEFVKKKLYNQSIDFFYSKINILYSQLYNCDLIILININDICNCFSILEKIDEKSNIALCINFNCFLNNKNKKIIYHYIKKHFSNFIISNSYGFTFNILPLLMLYKTVNMLINFNYILKCNDKKNNLFIDDLYILLEDIKKNIKLLKKNKVGIITVKKNIKIFNKNNFKNINKILIKKNLINNKYVSHGFYYINKKILDNCIKKYKNIIKACFLIPNYNNFNKKFPKYIIEILITTYCNQLNYTIYGINGIFK
tara:strand:- start:11071 stop:12177 length:1107 start_codon:yes stop_codon:yes gene_type:complete